MLSRARRIPAKQAQTRRWRIRDSSGGRGAMVKNMPVPELPSPQLTPAQIARLERLLKAGFTFFTFEQFARYPAVEKEGFVTLLDLAGGKVRQFGSMGYHMGNGIGVLIEPGGEPLFVYKETHLPASPHLLADFARVKRELKDLLGESLTE